MYIKYLKNRKQMCQYFQKHPVQDLISLSKEDAVVYVHTKNQSGILGKLFLSLYIYIGCINMFIYMFIYVYLSIYLSLSVTSDL